MSRNPGRWTEKRKAREQAGRRAETLAAWCLRLKGYRILGQRLKTKSGEVDILAARKGLIVIAEVKQRQSLDAAEDSTGYQDWRRIESAADTLIARDRRLQGRSVRFDIIFVIGRWRVIHRPDFWRPY